MANKVFFALLFFSLQLIHSSALATNVSTSSEKAALELGECNAPPPDSFRAICIGTNFISLSWIPAWVGANQEISVFKKSILGGWDSLNTTTTGTFNTFTFLNSEPNSIYKFKIATKCIDSGEASKFVDTLEVETVILDLIIDGRIPINPETTPYCKPVKYQNFNWVGFKISEISNWNPAINYFEFSSYANGIPTIKRPTNDINLVATRILDGAYPSLSMPLVKCLIYSFDIRRIINGLPSDAIGRLDLYYNKASKTVHLCINNEIPWSPSYQFTPLIAQSASGFQRQISENRDNNSQDNGGFEVENPFNDILTIFQLQNSNVTKTVTLNLINMSGKTILKQSSCVVSEHISLPTAEVPPGIYLLRIEYDGGIQNIKVIKS